MTAKYKLIQKYLNDFLVFFLRLNLIYSVCKYIL